MRLPGQKRYESPYVVDAGDQLQVQLWWESAEARVRERGSALSWLTGWFMITMALGMAAESRKGFPTDAYALTIRIGHALRMNVEQLAPARPLDVSGLDQSAVDHLAGLPRDPDSGTFTDDLSRDDEALALEVVTFATDAAESPERFAEIVSIQPALWNFCMSISTDPLRVMLRERVGLKHTRGLGARMNENLLRYGFAFRALDEALGIATTSDPL